MPILQHQFCRRAFFGQDENFLFLWLSPRGARNPFFTSHCPFLPHLLQKFAEIVSYFTLLTVQHVRTRKLGSEGGMGRSVTLFSQKTCDTILKREKRRERRREERGEMGAERQRPAAGQKEQAIVGGVEALLNRIRREREAHFEFLLERRTGCPQ